MKLVVLDGPMRGEEFALERMPLVVGRDPGADVCLPLDPHTALLHCRILKEHGQLWLEDLGSGLGTRVYGRPKAARVPLFERDVFRIGHTRLSLVDDAVGADTAIRELTRSTPGPLDFLGSSAPPPTPQAAPPPASAPAPAPAAASPAAARGARGTAAVAPAAPPVAAPLLEALRKTRDAREVLAAAFEHLLTATRADAGMCLRVEAGIPLPEAVVERRAPDRPGDSPADARLRDAAYLRAVRERRTIAIADSHMAVARHELPALAADADGDPPTIRSLLYVPLEAKGEVAALLALESGRTGTFGPQALEEAASVRPLIEAVFAPRLEAADLLAVHREIQKSQDAIVASETRAVAGRLAAWVLAELATSGPERLRLALGALLPTPPPVEARPMDLNAVVREALAAVDPAGRGVAVDVELAPDLPELTGDPARLLQAVALLLDDAARAAAAGKRSIRVRTAATSESVTLGILDGEPPLAEAQRALAFRPFFHVRDGAGGPFLEPARRIVVEELGGDVSMQAEARLGNAFVLRFPRRTTVLVVDDDPDLLAQVQMRLEARRYVVQTARDGEEALARIQARPPDIVITDVRMPHMDGFSLVEHLRSTPQLALLPVIFLTSLGEEETRSRGFRLGADDFLTKNELEELDGRIASALARKARLESAMRARNAAEPAAAGAGKTAPAPAGAAARGVRGTLDQMGLASLLTVFQMDRRTGVLSLARIGGTATARVLLRDGRVVSAHLADTPERENNEAVYALLDWPDGRFEFEPAAVDCQDEVGEDTSHLLLEGAKRQDNRSRETDVF